MKKYYVFLISALCLCACNQEDPVNCLEGNYTYKVSGAVNVTSIGDIHLTPETGTMSITSMVADQEIIMSFNHNGGDAYDIRANVTKDSIYIHPINRYIDVIVAEDTLALGSVIHRLETFDVQVSGSGHQLSNGDVSFSLTYSGKALNEPSHQLSGKNIFLHCKRNAK